MMSRILRLMALAVVVASAFAGAVLAILPTMVVVLVTLFYNSAGGILLFLGSVIGLLSQPFSSVGSTTALPAFVLLDVDTRSVVLWSLAASVLCLIAAVTALSSAPIRNDRRWLLVGTCCLLACVAGGRLVTVSVVPAVAISVGHLISRRVHCRG